MMAVWAEADLVLADEFRDGNVPAKQAPLACAQMAFAALPSHVIHRFFRGDSACQKVQESTWETYDTEDDGTLRQWAEVDFVPGEAREKKDSHPLRYVGLRLLKPQGVLFADGSDLKHHAVITNLKTEGSSLLNWHREKAGTVEHVHDEVKNELGGGHMLSQHFAVNAAWFKLALVSYNLASAIKDL